MGAEPHGFYNPLQNFGKSNVCVMKKEAAAASLEASAHVNRLPHLLLMEKAAGESATFIADYS